MGEGSFASKLGYAMGWTIGHGVSLGKKGLAAAKENNENWKERNVPGYKRAPQPQSSQPRKKKRKVSGGSKNIEYVIVKSKPKPTVRKKPSRKATPSSNMGTIPAFHPPKIRF